MKAGSKKKLCRRKPNRYARVLKVTPEGLIWVTKYCHCKKGEGCEVCDPGG